MDIFEQIEKVIRQMETRERENQTEKMLEEAMILEEMSRKYRKFVENHQWDKAHDCIEIISRFVGDRLAR
jgi:hypothetical protein